MILDCLSPVAQSGARDAGRAGSVGQARGRDGAAGEAASQGARQREQANPHRRGTDESIWFEKISMYLIWMEWESE